MVTPEVYIQHKLISAPAVAKVVGQDVFNVYVPKADTTLPFVVYRRSSTGSTSVLSNDPLNLPLTQFVVSSWAEDLATARELGDAVREALNGAAGDLGGITIVSILLTNELDDFVDPTPAGAQLPLAYEVRQVYQIRWQRA